MKIPTHQFPKTLTNTKSWAQLSAAGDQELASISKTVSAAFSPKVFAADDNAGSSRETLNP